MPEGHSSPPGIVELVRRFILTGMAALYNRSELFQVELQEEKNRMLELLVWLVVASFLGMMFALLLTATIILMFPESLRVYAAAGFCLLFLAGAVLALLNLKALVKNTPPPFADTIAEVKKDCEWFKSLK